MVLMPAAGSGEAILEHHAATASAPTAAASAVWRELARLPLELEGVRRKRRESGLPSMELVGGDAMRGPKRDLCAFHVYLY